MANIISHTTVVPVFKYADPNIKIREDKLIAQDILNHTFASYEKSILFVNFTISGI